MNKTAYFLLFLVVCIVFSPSIKAQNSTIEDTGDIALIALPAATLATTVILGDYKGSWQFTKGFVLNQAITWGLKASIKKTRPDGSDENSFPSGHTSTVFQSASFVHRRYGFTYSIPAYAIAGFTAISRVHANRHDGYDVLFGAIIGIGSTYLFTTPYQQEHMELTFNSTNGDYVLGFKYKF
jgi:membrane-associated phospholipid phosphatase